MANYEKLKSGKYRIRVSDGFTLTAEGKKKRVYRTMLYTPKGKTESRIIKEVEKQAAIFEHEVKSGDVVPSKKRFNKVYEEWLVSDIAKSLTERTRQDYIFNIKRYGFPVFGNKEMEKITSYDCTNLITNLEKDHAPATVHKIVACINSVFEYAVSSTPQIIKENPLSSRRLPSLTKKNKRRKKIKEDHTFSIEQASRFLKAIKEPYSTTCTRYNRTFTEERSLPLQLQCFYTLAIYGGFRRGEMLALTWKDLNFKTHEIHIWKSTTVIRVGKDEKGKYIWKQMVKDTTKTDAGTRTVIVPEECFSLLRRWKSEELQRMLSLGDAWKGKDAKHFNDNFIFIQEDGTQMYHTTPYLAFKRFIKRYNESADDPLPNIRLHDLRHTCASILVAEKEDVKKISTKLGHSKVSTTLDFYAEDMAEGEKETSEVLEKALG